MFWENHSGHEIYHHLARQFGTCTILHYLFLIDENIIISSTKDFFSVNVLIEQIQKIPRQREKFETFD